MEKFCPGCLVKKPLDKFHKDRNDKKWGVVVYCKECIKERHRKLRLAGKPTNKIYNNPVPTVTEWRCPNCKKTKPASEFNRDKSKRTGISVYCRECTKDRR